LSNITIYHNPRCSKCRQALTLLKEAGELPIVVRYLDTPPDAATLERVLHLLGLEPQAVMRTGEERYKELGLANRQLSRGEAITLLVENPILLERPIVVIGDRALIARPPERVRELLS
jgi:arsenate reductase